MSSRLAVGVAHLIGNALLLWLGYYWLGTSESDMSHLLWSALIAFLLVAGTVWLHGLALAHFSGFTFSMAASRAARNLLPLLALSLAAIALYSAILGLSRSDGQVSYLVGSYSTLRLHKPVPPTAVEKAFQFVFWLIEWLAIPAILLPLARAISVEGWRGWNRHSLHRSRHPLYWVEVILLLLCALWVPLKLFFWIPQIPSFTGQMASFVARTGIAYLLFVAASLALEFFTSSGKPREIQPSTADSP